MRFLVAIYAILVSGCVSIADINQASMMLENAWLLDYQKVEDSLRTRVIDNRASDTFFEVKKTLVDLGLPVISSDMVKGTILARGVAPTPLTQEEWEKVVEVEQPRVKELSNGVLYLSKDAKSLYILTVVVTVHAIDDKSLVVLDYEVRSPKYESYGLQLPKVAPPTAVLIGSQKFWSALTERLIQASKPTPRKRLPNERAV